MKKLFLLRMPENWIFKVHLNEFNKIMDQLHLVNVNFDEEVQALLLWVSCLIVGIMLWHLLVCLMARIWWCLQRFVRWSWLRKLGGWSRVFLVQGQHWIWTVEAKVRTMETIREVSLNPRMEGQRQRILTTTIHKTTKRMLSVSIVGKEDTIEACAKTLKRRMATGLQLM